MLHTLVFVVSSFCFATVTANTCNKLPYKDLLFLSKYPPAETFCSSHYPQPTVTVKVARRDLADRGRGIPVTVPTTTPTPTPCTGAACLAWSSCTKIGGGFLSTLCSCIEKPSTTTIHTSSAAPTCTPGPVTVAQSSAEGNCGCTYDTHCGWFGSGGSVAGENPISTSLEGCRDACDEIEQCTYFTWVGATADVSQSGGCHFYGYGEVTLTDDPTGLNDVGVRISCPSGSTCPTDPNDGGVTMT